MSANFSPFQEQSRLDQGYFKTPKIWRFNTPDFYVFYYALGAVLSVLLIVVLLIALASNRESASEQIENNQAQQTPAAEEQVIESSAPVQNTDQALSSPIASPPNTVVTPPQSSSELISAEQQPSYALKAEAFSKLKDNPAISQADKEQAALAYQKYHELATQAQNRLQTALDGIRKDRYTVSIRQIQALIQEGEILGDVYLQAQTELPKAFYKKIDYFMLQGQISKASRVLVEAKEAGVQTETLNEYETKIKNLIKVSK